MATLPVAVQEKLALRPVQNDLGLKEEYALETSGLKLGRHSTNDVVIPSKSVSRFHAKIVHEGEDFLLNDLQSSNGTQVNGEQILHKVLQPGMRIKLGDVGFMCEQLVELAPVEESKVADSNGMVTLLSTPELEAAYQRTIKPESTDQLTSRQPPDDLEAMRLANQQLKILYRLSEELSPINTEEHMLSSALELVFEAVPVDHGVILTRDSLDDELRNRVFRNRSENGQDSQLKISRSVVERCLNEQVAILIRDTAAQENYDPSASIIQNQIHSIICAPLMGTRNVMGILLIDTRHLTHSYNDDDLAFVSNIAQELALALELRTHREDLLRNSQMVAMGETILNIAHGIKNILQVSDAGREMVEDALANDKLKEAKHY